jgi:hypothetical protein
MIIKNKLNKSNFNIKYKQSFSLLFVLNYFNISIPENAEPLIHYAFGVFITSFICLTCFINILMYFIALHMLNKYKIDDYLKKYPRIFKIFNYYLKTSLFFIVIETVICLFSLLFIFNGYEWNDIVNLMKEEHNIILTPGAVARRHVLNITMYNLVTWLNCIGFDQKIVDLMFDTFSKKAIIKSLSSKSDMLAINTLLNSNIKRKINNKDKRNYHTSSINYSNPINYSSNSINYNNSINYSSNPINYSNSSINYNIENDENEFVETLRELIIKSPGNEIEIQKNIEHEWINIFQDKINSRNNKIMIQSELNKIYKEAQITLDIYNEHKKLQKMNPELYPERSDHRNILIALTIILHYYTFSSKTNISMMISDRLIYEIYRKRRLSGHNNLGSYKDFLVNSDINKNINKKVRLGILFTELFKHKPIDIFESDWKIHKDGLIEYLKINLKYVDKLKNNIIVSPKSLPMICPPAKWSDSKYGGYMENEYYQNDLITGNKLHNHKIENKDKIYSIINRLNNIKLGINVDLLNYLNNNGKELIDSYTDKINLENKLEGQK